MTHEEIQQLAALDAIGAASADEVKELRRHLADCDECSRAADELDETAAMIALTADPVAPPAHVRDHVLRGIRGRDTKRWWLSAAAMLVLVVLGWNAVQLRRARDAQRELETEVARLRVEREQLAQTIEALSDTTRMIHLAGQTVAPSASASVFVDAPQRRAYVFFYNLPVNANDKSYQLWIIRADQVAPQSAGVFNVDTTGNASLVVQNLPVDTLIKALAVTLEPKGGVASPTGEKYLVGM